MTFYWLHLPFCKRSFSPPLQRVWEVSIHCSWCHCFPLRRGSQMMSEESRTNMMPLQHLNSKLRRSTWGARGNTLFISFLLFHWINFCDCEQKFLLAEVRYKEFKHTNLNWQTFENWTRQHETVLVQRSIQLFWFGSGLKYQLPWGTVMSGSFGIYNCLLNCKKPNYSIEVYNVVGS